MHLLKQEDNMANCEGTNSVPNPSNEQAPASPNHIHKVIGIVSAKGGVGKSFITGLMACEAARYGYKVGILDADLYGSSIPLIFGVHGPVETGVHSFLPLQSDSGIKIISPNLLLEEERQPIYWKESQIGKLIGELCLNAEWGAVDFLFVDLPPVTSEAGFSILQTLPFAGLILVTQPQKLSATIVTKAIHAANQIGVNILGIVENMSYFHNPGVKDRQEFVENSESESLTITAMAPVIAKIPFDPEVTRLSDAGRFEDVRVEGSLDFFEIFLDALAFLENQDASSAPQSSCVNSPFTASRFSDIVMDLIRREENMGTLEHPDAQGYFLGSCGDRMQIDLQLAAGKIEEARFLADGCGATLACGSMITSMACSKTLDQAQKITSEELLTALGGLPEDHLHCAELAVMTLREAIIDANEGHANQRSGKAGIEC
jgi:Mrp family chromosome partitioning ATPase/NifU-like protein involved in Fe-S cluster formation